MRIICRWTGLLLALALSACASTPTPPPTPPKPPLTILVSIDGFRADYLDRGETPVLGALAADGARGTMTPSFPSLTFPNHYTLVTGLRPDHHGVVGNAMEDPGIEGAFRSSDAGTAGDARWWNGAAPLWVSAERQGVRSAVMLWPGSQADIRGVRPSRWLPYDKAMTSARRVDGVLSWIDDRDLKPGLAALYLDVVDIEGHHHGPDSPQLHAATVEVDAAIGRLVEGLKARGLWEGANLVIVSDHGMADQPLENTVVLDDLVDPAKLRLIGPGALVGVRPVPGAEAVVTAALTRPHPHMTCWEKARIPARFHYGRNPRVPPIVCLAQRGWSINVATAKARTDVATHGYDPADPTMRAVFVAHGPAFRRGVVLPTFDNVDIYPLMTRLLGVQGEPGDGRLGPVKAALR
jgi:predicted AlkP superfamily pyrophosphatase or phosphodiesterase